MSFLSILLGACGGDGEPAGHDGSGGAGSGGQVVAETGGTTSGGTGGVGASDAGGSSTGATGSGASASGGGAMGTKLSGPTPTYDPDFVASISGYRSGAPSLSVWRRYQESASGPVGTCSSVLDGNCALFTCDPGTDFEGEGTAYLDVGTVAASYERDGTQSGVEVMVDFNQVASSGTLAPELELLGGELITISVNEGEDIPAITAMIPFPSRLITTNAGATVDGEWIVPVNSSQDFVLSWEGGAPGVLYQVVGGAQGESLLYCEFESSLGTAILPSALVSQLTPGIELNTISTSAYRENVSGYDVSIAAGAETLDVTEALRVRLLVQ